MRFQKLILTSTTVLFLLGGCNSHHPKTEAIVNSTNEKQPTTMITEKDFNQLLEKKGLPAVYVHDSTVWQQQVNYSGSITATDAFNQGLESLFVHADSCIGCDDFYSMVTSQPESFQLSAAATKEEIKKAIVNEMSKDKDLKICLLPEDTEKNAPAGITVFPPENGELVKDYWIWYIKCSFFPGPAWILVKRDGSIPAYHYGFM